MSKVLKEAKAYFSKSKLALLAFFVYNMKLGFSPKKFYGQSAEDAILQILLPAPASQVKWGDQPVGYLLDNYPKNELR